MKTKLSVFVLCICSIALLASCSRGQNKSKATTETISKPIREFLSKQYPNATILEVDKKKNGTEIDIQEKNIHKEVWFDKSEKWVSTRWKVREQDVPVAITDALIHSAYAMYKVEDITAVEKPDGMFYEFELKQDDNEVRLVFDSKAQIAVQ